MDQTPCCPTNALKPASVARVLTHRTAHRPACSPGRAGVDPPARSVVVPLPDEFERRVLVSVRWLRDQLAA